MPKESHSEQWDRVAREDSGHLAKFEFQINNKEIPSIIMSEILHGHP